MEVGSSRTRISGSTAQKPRERHPLLLAARERVRFPTLVTLGGRRLRIASSDPFEHLPPWYAKVLQPEGYVILHERRDEPVVRVLEEHPNSLTHLERLGTGALCPATRISPELRLEQPVQQTDQGGFAATVRTNDTDVLPAQRTSKLMAFENLPVGYQDKRSPRPHKRQQGARRSGPPRRSLVVCPGVTPSRS